MAAVLAAILLACTACTRFENPLVGDGGGSFDPALAGRWSTTTDQGTVQLDISAREDRGHARLTVTEPGKPAEVDEGRLVTARIDRWTFASLFGDKRGGQTWTLVRYELHAPDRLAIYPDNNRFWKNAIHDQLIPGELTGGQLGQSATVTASSEELRGFILGYGSVIFEDTPILEFTRVD